MKPSSFKKNEIKKLVMGDVEGQSLRKLAKLRGFSRTSYYRLKKLDGAGLRHAYEHELRFRKVALKVWLSQSLKKPLSVSSVQEILTSIGLPASRRSAWKLRKECIDAWVEAEIGYIRDDSSGFDKAWAGVARDFGVQCCGEAMLLSSIRGKRINFFCPMCFSRCWKNLEVDLQAVYNESYCNKARGHDVIKFVNEARMCINEWRDTGEVMPAGDWANRETEDSYQSRKKLQYSGVPSRGRRVTRMNPKRDDL